MRWPFRNADDGPEWNDASVRKLVGATVLVGITYDDPAGERLEQFFGTVMNANRRDGIVLRLEGSRAGDSYALPPDLDALVPARSGVYRLREAGEEIVDPDYTTTWVITPPAH